MKKILALCISLVCISVHAENWLNHSKVKSGSNEAYSLKSDCERTSNEKCYDIGLYPSSVYSEVDSNEDDFNKPIYSKNEIESCATNEICDSIHISKVCSNQDEYSIKNYDLNQVYCSKVIGYEAKAIKVIALDSSKVTAWQAQEAIKTALAQKESSVQYAVRKIDCGKRVIGLMVVRNFPKNLTPSQIAQMNTVYAPIKGLLETASLVTAKAAIEGTTADGTLITEADKTDLAAETQKCIDL